MTILRRNLLRLWILCSLLWLAFFLKEVINHPPSDNEMGNVAVAFLLPPIICFLLGWGLTRVWERFGEAHWLRLPENLRRGLTRLYLVVAVPWVAWFVFEIFNAGTGYRSQRDIAYAFRMLLIVPIGGPILVLVIVWVVAGFRKSENKIEKTQDVSAHNADSPLKTFAPRSSVDYYAVINRAVVNLASNDRTNRQRIYELARKVLHSELRGQDRSRTKCEWKSFEKAVRNVETDAATRQRAQQKIEPASTPLLVFSLLFPSYWMIDCTSTSLYWVARLPSLRREKDR